MKPPGRMWRYKYGEWSPRWWNYIVPFGGSDEWGRNTLVQHVPGWGFLVFAYWTCYCEDCIDTRLMTMKMRSKERP